MLLLIVKYCSIIMCSFYVCLKLINLKITKKEILLCVLFILFFLPEIYFIRRFSASLSIFIIVVVFSFFVKEFIKLSINLSLIVSTISFGIVYIAFLIAAAIIYPVGFYFSFFFKEYPSNLISLIFIGILQFLLLFRLFKFKRLKKGMPFLTEYGSSNIGVYISILLLIAISFASNNKSIGPIYTIPVFFSLFCGLALIVWWKNSIFKNYISTTKAKETEQLQKTIMNLNIELEQIKYHNNELSKIIHKDNKLIPAMEFAVRNYLISAENEANKEVLINKAHELLIQLEYMSQERTGILNTYEIKSKGLPKTDVASVDTLILYMCQKSNENCINFDLSISGSIKYLIQNIIDEIDVQTILSDLIENAIIATKKSTKKKIMVNIGLSNNIYSIDIFDSGEPFTVEILLNIGLKNTTTHLYEGGSGIGLMTVFEISHKYKASFVVEYLSDEHFFTKKVSVCFDNLGQYRIKSKNNDEIRVLSSRADILLVN
ncbi:MAG: hypothetical protein K0R00_1767 [Herbinix sp.]|nr:hypothetical protein [Herbinix sp.]